MEHNLLHKMLRHLTAEEFRDFILFTDSPFFNRDKRVGDLLRRLQPAYPEFADSPAIAMNTLVKALQLGTEGNLRQLRSRAVKLLRQFFIQLELRRQPNTNQLLLLDSLLHHQLDKDFRDELESFAAQINPDDRPFHAQFRLEGLRLKELLRSYESDLVFSAYINSGNRYFLLKKLKQACQLLLLQRIYQKQESDRLFQELVFLLKFHRKMVRDNAVLHAWEKMLRLLEAVHVPAGAGALWGFIEENRSAIPLKEQKDLHNTYNSYLVGRLNRGHFNTLETLNWYYENLAGLFRFAAANNLLCEGTHIPHQRFKNVVSAACIVGQTAWAREFIAENLPKVLAEFQNDLRNFCLGSVAFYEGDFKEAGSLLARVSARENEFYFYDLASVQMRIYLLQKEIDPFDSRAEAVRKKLAKSRLSVHHQTSYINYFRFLKEFFNLKINPATNREAWTVFRQKVEETNPVNQKKWLLQNIPDD